MANTLKQLAGQTMIYGLSTILARIINFLFVPIYTRLLSPTLLKSQRQRPGR